MSKEKEQHEKGAKKAPERSLKRNAQQKLQSAMGKVKNQVLK